MNDATHRVPLRVAGKAIGKTREYVRELVERGEVTAYRIGGTDRNPRLVVDPDEVARAHDRVSLYRPAKVKAARRRQVSPVNLHPMARSL